MGGDVDGGLLGVGQVHDLHVARVGAGEGEQGVVAVGTQHAEAWREEKHRREAGCDGIEGAREIIDERNPLAIPRSIKAAEAGGASPGSRPKRVDTFGVVAGLKDVQLMGVVGEGEDFDHRVQDHHDPGRREETGAFYSKQRRRRQNI